MLSVMLSARPCPAATLSRQRGKRSVERTAGRAASPAGAGSSAPAYGTAATLPFDIQNRLLYRDGLVLILDKPTGIAVHSGPGGGPHLEHWFPLLRFGLPRPPALAHRLDRDTSGCLVLGRHPKALRRLGRLFAEGLVEKVYWAIVAGAPAESAGRIATGLRKETRGAGWRVVIDPAGQHAVTDYRVLAEANGRAWIELRPRTGRTHQVRVHCAALGCPIVGDPVYGGPARREARDTPLLLHARSISVPLYPGKPPITAVAPTPLHMNAVLARIGGDAEMPR
jgi:tRNA pseudouridine32 synthase/23S rRNA pseudouridine746 synthase/23S rRNA pseudouridine1911/1915/1917 synthase